MGTKIVGVIEAKVFVAVGVWNVLVEVGKLGRSELTMLRLGDMVVVVFDSWMKWVGSWIKR